MVQMSGNEEFITQESIDAQKAEYNKLFSNRDELIKLTKELMQIDDQIDQINPRIQIDLHQPMKPSVLDLADKDNLSWNNYFEEANRRIQEKKDRESFGKQLESLKKERKEIESKIIPLVPSSYHDIQIIVFSSRRMTISGKNVIIVFN